MASAIIRLMQGVVYREKSDDVWRTLERHPAPVRDHFSEIGIVIVIDDLEGYAYLRASETDEGEEPLPRLVKRRSLTYAQSLLVLLLRKRLAEFEGSGEEGKLVLEREQLVELLRVFLQESTNEARVIQKADQTIEQVVKLGFLKPLRSRGAARSHAGAWEVQRIIKAYVDAETMSDFSAKLAEYAATEGSDGDE
ncbi:MAG: DUF4194 domain-containing protein [Leucobacter sp.]